MENTEIKAPVVGLVTITTDEYRTLLIENVEAKQNLERVSSEKSKWYWEANEKEKLLNEANEKLSKYNDFLKSDETAAAKYQSYLLQKQLEKEREELE